MWTNSFVILIIAAISVSALEKNEHHKEDKHHQVKHQKHQNKIAMPYQERCEVLCTPGDIFPPYLGPGPVIINPDNMSNTTNSTESGNSTTVAAPLSNETSENSVDNTSTSSTSVTSASSDENSTSANTEEPESEPENDSEDKKKRSHHAKKHFVNVKDFHKLKQKYHKYTKAKLHSKHHSRGNFPDNCNVICPCRPPRFCPVIFSEELSFSEDEKISASETGTAPSHENNSEPTEEAGTGGEDDGYPTTIIPSAEKKKKRTHHKSHNKHHNKHENKHEHHIHN